MAVRFFHVTIHQDRAGEPGEVDGEGGLSCSTLAAGNTEFHVAYYARYSPAGLW